MGPLPRFTGIHHLALVTGDMDATVRFWRDLLGMRLVYASGGPGYRQYFFELNERALIAFFEWPEVERSPNRTHGTPVPGHTQFDHVCIGVENEAALWALAEILQGAGFPASDVVDHGLIRSLYTHDPNGIPVEFAAAVPGIDIRREPVLADDEPPATRIEGSEPQPGQWPPAEPIPADERTRVPGDGWEHFHPLGGARTGRG